MLNCAGETIIYINKMEYSLSIYYRIIIIIIMDDRFIM